MKVSKRAILTGLAVSVFAFLSWFLGHVFDYDEVTRDTEYANLAGEKFKIEKEIVAVGVTMDQNYQGDADRIYLKKIGSSGPQVKFRQPISEGVLKIVRVHKEKWFIGDGIYYRVEYDGAIDLPKLPIYLRVTESIKSENLGLDPKLYKHLQ